jgi:uncharacterized protein YjbI with pentapeptide repeats
LSHSNFTIAYRGYEPPIFAARFNNAKLNNANLSHGVYRGAEFSHSDLNSANLAYAELSQCDFSHADLNGANMTQAHSEEDAMHGWGTDWRGTDFSNANLKGAVLYGIFAGADFTNANLQNACLISSNMALPGRQTNIKDPWKGVRFHKANTQNASILSNTSTSSCFQEQAHKKQRH